MESQNTDYRIQNTDRLQNTEYAQRALHVSCVLQDDEERKEKAEMEKREKRKGGKAKGKK
jgi:hypothetical protein